jgi:hypothetical protein
LTLVVKDDKQHTIQRTLLDYANTEVAVLAQVDFYIEQVTCLNMHSLTIYCKCQCLTTEECTCLEQHNM